MLVKQLNANHPERTVDMWLDYDALYKGGRCFRDRVKRFLVQNPAEPFETWSDRCKEAVYRSYIGTVVDFFAAQMFAVPIIYKPIGGQPPEWFESVENDCDGKGTDLIEFLRECLVAALVTKTATVALDFPETYGKASSLYEADATGATDIKLRHVPQPSILDWERDQRGNLLWCCYKQESKPRETPEVARDKTRHEWTVSDRESVSVYRVDVDEGKTLNENSSIAPEVEVKHGLGRVPAVELTVGDGLWIASRLESAQIEHFRLSSGLSWSIKRTCYAMPLFKVADPENFVPGKMGAGYWITIGSEDSAEFMAPPTGHLSLTSEEIKSQKDEIFRLVAQMSLGVDNNAAAVGRSGESKIADAEAIRVVLRAYAVLVRDFLKSILNLLSRARGDQTEWTVEGLDKFETLAPETLVALLKEALTFGIPSETFQIEAKYRAAIGVVPGLDEDTRRKIRGEIETGIQEQRDNDEELREIARGVGSGEETGPETDRGDRGPSAPADEEADQDSARRGRGGYQKSSPAVPRGPSKRAAG